MNNLLKIPYSSKLPDALQISSKQFEQEAVMAMAVILFELKRLFSGMAASLVGVDRVTFLLSLHNLFIFAKTKNDMNMTNVLIYAFGKHEDKLNKLQRK